MAQRLNIHSGRSFPCRRKASRTQRLKRYVLPWSLLLALAGCAGQTETGRSDRADGPAPAERGEYLVGMLGCGRCHTDGGLVGSPEGPWLAGSSIGIAYTDYVEDERPGVVFAGNLTPDRETGLGGWTKAAIVRAIRMGIDDQNRHVLPVMPWPSYSLLNDEDLSDIADYLLSLPPVRNAVPENVPRGTASPAPYVRFGVYRFDPTGRIAELPQPPG